MALPENLDDWEQLQDTWRRVHNRRVREHFNDLAGVDDPWDAEIETPRGALRYASTMKDTDTADMTVLRTLLFWVVLGEAAALQTPVYGIPVPSFQEANRFRPQIQLYFQENSQDVESTYAPVTGEISFRLMNETSETITPIEAQRLANKVHTAFATGPGFVWKKGRVMCSYTDRNRGYKLQLLCYNKTEGRRVIEQVLDIQGHTPDWANLNVSENEEASSRYSAVPRSDRVYGQTRRLPRQRPVANVRFKYAALHIWGLKNPIILVDRSGYFSNALVS